MSFLSSRICQSINIFGALNRAALIEPSSTIQIRNYAARKGTRERKMKKKVKAAEVVKVGFIPHNQRKKDRLLAQRVPLKFKETRSNTPVDNVYHVRFYKWKTYSFEEAVKAHQETHHPDMYNVPNAPLHVAIELYMQAEKKTRLVDDFNRVVAVPHPFEHGEERSVIAFAKKAELHKEALEAGAQLAGGTELIKQIQNGEVSLQNFKYVIAHPDILPELVTLRGLMKRKFPNPKNGTLDVDLATVTKKYLNGINYVGKKDEHETDFGLVKTIIGSLDMGVEKLEKNFAVLIEDLNSIRPRRAGTFISRVILSSPPSKEKLVVDLGKYVPEEKTGQKQEEEDDEEESGERVAL